mmetsp:Transcript_26607/g.47343  ORF Transcript_26607/g.47343 Transcript_26607/m.47343 type:complete len:296 (+) Transcript_26607:138-1025(+)
MYFAIALHHSFLTPFIRASLNAIVKPSNVLIEVWQPAVGCSICIWLGSFISYLLGFRNVSLLNASAASQASTSKLIRMARLGWSPEIRPQRRLPSVCESMPVLNRLRRVFLLASQSASKAAPHHRSSAEFGACWQSWLATQACRTELYLHCVNAVGTDPLAILSGDSQSEKSSFIWEAGRSSCSTQQPEISSRVASQLSSMPHFRCAKSTAAAATTDGLCSTASLWLRSAVSNMQEHMLLNVIFCFLLVASMFVAVTKYSTKSTEVGTESLKSVDFSTSDSIFSTSLAEKAKSQY